MKIEMAKHSGFCMGVKNAILKIVDELNSSEEQILVYGPLIHNPQTIEVLKQRGLVTINSLDEIAGKQIAIRTHGIPVDENRKIRHEASRTINLTCSRVARVQSIIKKYSSSGYYTIIIGDKEHAEVIGLKSYASAGVTVVSEAKDINDIPHGRKYIVVSQTTHERNEFEAIVNVIINMYKDVLIIDTICDSTRLRQDDVKDGILKGIDTLVVVGGKNSANTTRLAKIGVDNGIHTVHIETDDELNNEDFYNSKYVLVTAGASTPGWIINNVLEKLYYIKYSQSNFLIKSLKLTFEFLVRSNIVSALASAIMVFIAQKYAEIKTEYNYGLISFLYIFIMYSVNNYLDKDFLAKSNSYKYKIYKKYGRYFLLSSIIFMMLSIFICYKTKPILSLLILFPYFLGVIYSTSLVKKMVRCLGYVLIEKIYNTKVVTGLGWLVVILLLPYFYHGVPFLKYLSLGMYFFTFIFLRQMVIDMVAFQGDLILGRETLPTWLGIKRSSLIAYIMTILGSLNLFAVIIYYDMLKFSPLLIPLVFYMIILKKIEKTDYLISLRYEFIIDSNFLFLLLIYLYII